MVFFPPDAIETDLLFFPRQLERRKENDRGVGGGETEVEQGKNIFSLSLFHPPSPKQPTLPFLGETAGWVKKKGLDNNT